MTTLHGSTVHRACAEGVDAIVAELAIQLKAVGGVTAEVKTLVSNGRTVMVEHVDSFSIGGTPISSVVMAMVEVGEGKIRQLHAAYDLKSVTDAMEAAGFRGPD